MVDFYEALNDFEKIFFIVAMLGGGLFLVNIALQFLGTDAESDIDFGSGDSVLSFKFLSFQGLTSFLLMFGLVSLSLSHEVGIGPLGASLGGGVIGCFTTYLLKKVFGVFGRLHSSGTLDLNNAIYEEGNVYLTIARGETGKVRIPIQGRLKVLDAIAEGGEELTTGQKIRVIEVLENGVLKVQRSENATL